MTEENLQNEKPVEESFPAKEMENEKVKISLEEKPGCLVKLHIDVSKLASSSAYVRAVKLINKEVSIPGFRKGKAPESVIIQRFSSHIDREWKDLVVQAAFSEAIKLVARYPLNKDAVRKPQFLGGSRDEGARVQIEFEAYPEVPQIEVGGISLAPPERTPVTDEEIEDSIQGIRLHYASWRNIEERGIEEGDYVDLDIVEEERPDNVICSDVRFQVMQGKMGDWMRQLLLGRQVGDSVVGKSERSADLDAAVAFKPINCRVTVKGVRLPILEGLSDEELAQKVGASNYEEMRERVKSNLEREAEQKVQEALRKQVEEWLVREYPFEVPSSLLQIEMRSRIAESRREWEAAGVTTEEIKKRLDSDRLLIEEEAKNSLRIFFVARKIADEMGIGVSNNEMLQELMFHSVNLGVPIGASSDVEEAKSKIYVKLLLRKVSDYLVERALKK